MSESWYYRMLRERSKISALVYLMALSYAPHLQRITRTEAFLEVDKAVFTKLKRELFGGTIGRLRAILLARPWW